MTGLKESSKHLLFYSAVSVLSIPFLLWVVPPDRAGVAPLLMYASLLCGFFGVILLMTQFFLGTRTISGLFFEDLPWALRLHRQLGKYGTLLIFAHPILLLYPYAENLLYMLPNFGSAFERNVTWGRLAFLTIVIIWVTSAVLRSRIAYRPWRYVHLLSYFALPLVFLHAPPVGRSLTDNNLLLTYWYVLAGIYLCMAILKLRFFFGFGKHVAEVVASKQINADIWQLRLRVVGLSKPIQPGQYVYLQTKLLHEEHPFTVVDYDASNKELLVAYKRTGLFTKDLAGLEPGSHLLVDGPYGRFIREVELNPALPRVFIAGGIGITPFAKSILAAPASADQYLFYCNKTLESGIFMDKLTSKLGNKLITVVSQDGARTGQNIEHGRINTDIIAKYITQPTQRHYFVCGPRGMITTTVNSLRSLGVPPAHIHTEEFTF